MSRIYLEFLAHHISRYLIENVLAGGGHTFPVIGLLCSSRKSEIEGQLSNKERQVPAFGSGTHQRGNIEGMKADMGIVLIDLCSSWRSWDEDYPSLYCSGLGLNLQYLQVCLRLFSNSFHIMSALYLVCTSNIINLLNVLIPPFIIFIYIYVHLCCQLIKCLSAKIVS